MKKVFISLMVLAASLQTVSAQTPQTEQKSQSHQLTLIPKVGINYSTTNLDAWPGKDGGMEKPDVKGLVGPVVGVEAEYRFNDWLGGSAAVLYSMQGRKFDDTAVRQKMGSSETLKDATISTERHHYFNVPLTANFYVAPGLALRTGVQIGYLFHRNGTIEWPFDNETMKHSISNSPGKVDISIPIGVSYALSNGLQFDLRYNHGLNKISRSEGIMKEQNRVVQFTVGYRLNLLH
jgi:hypothetical protein